MGWGSVPLDKIEHVLKLLGKTVAETGKYTIKKEIATKFVMENQI